MDINFIFSIIILIFSVVLHELAHGIAAEAQGDPTPRLQGRITLNPFKHLDPIGSLLVPFLTYNLGGFIFGWAKPVEFNPYNLRNQRWGEAIIAIAGPLTNLVIAFFFGMILRFSGVLNFDQNVLNFIAIIVIVNLALAIFNLIPVPPLDGSKILFAFLPLRMQYVRTFIENFSFLLILGVLFLGGSYISYFINLFFKILVGI